jgi:hypothetical protein
MLPPGPAPEHLALAPSFAPGSSCSGSDPCAGLNIRTAKLVRGISVMTSILWLLVRTLSSSSSASTPDQDSSDDYLKIGTSAYGEPAEGGHLILMVAPNGNQSHNRSSVSQAIMETIQRMVPDGSPFAAWLIKGLRCQTLSL